MAREIHERENLLRDATALVQRVELKITATARAGHSPNRGFDLLLPHTLFAGFRSQGQASLYLDDDPVYHFNQAGKVRRAFIDGQIIKAQHGQLVSWLRHQADQRVEMLPHRLAPHEQHEWLAALGQRLKALRQVLETRTYKLAGQIPEASNAVDRLRQWLETHQEIEIADGPGVG